jgi:Peptidase S24-like
MELSDDERIEIDTEKFRIWVVSEVKLRNQTVLAEALGVKTPTVHRWLNSTPSTLRGETFIKIAAYRQMPVEEVYRWIAIDELSPVKNLRAIPLDIDFITIDIMSLLAGCGNGGGVSEGEVLGQISMPRDYIKKILKTNPNSLACFQSVGDSMEPTIESDSLVFFDRSSTAIRGNVYAVRLNGELYFKRLTTINSKTVEASSDNKAYQPILIDLSDESIDFEVLGRMVGRMIAD